MTNIAKRIATKTAMRRFVYAMREYLQSTLDEFTVHDLKAPRDSAYFLAGKTLDRELLTAHPNLCIIEQPRRATEDYELTVQGGDRGVQVLLPLRVRIVFELPAHFSPGEVQGKVQTVDEWMTEVAQDYAGAVIDVISKHAPENYSVADARLESDLALTDVLPEQNDEILIGGCVLDWVVEQAAYVPAPAWTLAR